MDIMILKNLNRFSTDTGHLTKLHYAADPIAASIREVYISEMNPGCINAWKSHNECAQNFIVVQGKVLIVSALYSSANDSYKFGTAVLSESDTRLISIPAGVFYGFKPLEGEACRILNVIDQDYDDNKVVRIGLDKIKFDWNIAL